MEEFEKWDEKEYSLPPTIERGPIGRYGLNQRKHTWRAALEWVLKMMRDNSYGPGDISSDIIEELGDN